jgi:hypothetical protein
LLQQWWSPAIAVAEIGAYRRLVWLDHDFL